MKKLQHRQVVANIMRLVWAKPESAKQIQIALMHRSWVNESQDPETSQYREDNERLEFLGDAVLGLVIAKELYQRLLQQDEGRLSKAKARLVSAETLAARARELHLGSALLLGRGEEQSGGRERDSLLANALEAVIGAVFLSESFHKAEAFVLSLWKNEIESEITGLRSRDYKTQLQEYMQKQYGELPVYTVEKIMGPDHKREYEIAVTARGQVIGRGRGPTKKQAAQVAAAQAYHALVDKNTVGEDI
ncbi:ribonuclease III [candidate division FCPU426 bacterium]|nr:ribonuclease III [candidate division FCPU426 bacterium]